MMPENAATATQSAAAQEHQEHAPADTPTPRTPDKHARLTALHNSFKPVWLTETITLGPWLPSDRETLVEYLNDARIHSYLCGPPFPYTLKDADFWLGSKVDRMTDKGTLLDFCFRDMAKGGKAIGSLAVTDVGDDQLDGDDTGYWLAPEYHGQGLMSKALRMMLHRVSMVEVGKRKFNAHAFLGNHVSRHIMEKIGFVVQQEADEEGKKLQRVVKNGEEIPMWTLRLYVTDEDVERWEVVPEATPLPSLVNK